MDPNRRKKRGYIIVHPSRYGDGRSGEFWGYDSNNPAAFGLEFRPAHGGWVYTCFSDAMTTALDLRERGLKSVYVVGIRVPLARFESQKQLPLLSR